MFEDRTSSIVMSSTPEVPSAEMIAGGFLARYPLNTREGYRLHLRHWFEFCAEHGVPVMSAQRMHIEAFARHVAEDLDRKPATVASKLNAICGLYKFAFLDGYIPVDPSVHVRRPKVEFKSTTNGLTRTEFAAVLGAAKAESLTTHALICLLGLNGMRLTETLEANVEHLGEQAGYRTIYLPHRKGGKTGRLSLSIETAWTIQRLIDGRESGPLLLGRDGERMSAGSARRTVNRLCRKCGITKRITPHSFRVTFVTLCRKAGVAAEDVADATGHGDVRMVNYYDHDRGSVERNPTHVLTPFIGAAA